MGEMISPKIARSAALSNILKIYFDYTYVLCLVPFRFVWDGESRTFRFRTFTPQKILCAIVQVFNTFLLLRDLYYKSYQQPLKAFESNPVRYFQLLHSLFNLFYKLTLFKMVWLNRHQFLQLINYLDNPVITALLNHSPSKSRRLLTPLYIHIAFLFYVFVATFGLVTGRNFLPYRSTSSGFKDLSPSRWYRGLIIYARKVFFINLSANKMPEPMVISTWENILYAAFAVGLLIRFAFGFFIDLYILSLASTLFVATTSFARMLVFDPYQKWIGSQIHPEPFLVFSIAMNRSKQLMNRDRTVPPLRGWSLLYTYFNVLRITSLLINRALGSLVLWFCLEALLYYSVNMDAFLITNDNFRRVYILPYYLGTMAIFLVSARICHKLEAVGHWLKEDEHRIRVPMQDLQMVLHEMLAKDVGIRGGNIFTITFALFANFIGTVIMFFIICLMSPPVDD